MISKDKFKSFNLGTIIRFMHKNKIKDIKLNYFSTQSHSFKKHLDNIIYYKECL